MPNKATAYAKFVNKTHGRNQAEHIKIQARVIKLLPSLNIKTLEKINKIANSTKTIKRSVSKKRPTIPFTRK